MKRVAYVMMVVLVGSMMFSQAGEAKSKMASFIVVAENNSGGPLDLRQITSFKVRPGDAQERYGLQTLQYGSVLPLMQSRDTTVRWRLKEKVPMVGASFTFFCPDRTYAQFTHFIRVAATDRKAPRQTAKEQVDSREISAFTPISAKDTKSIPPICHSDGIGKVVCYFDRVAMSHICPDKNQQQKIAKKTP